MTSPWAEETLPRFLRPATAATAAAASAAPWSPSSSSSSSWQPADLLPDPSRPTFRAAVGALRASAAQLPDELVACLALQAVSDAVLPLALPALLNASAAASLPAAALPPRDRSGSDAHAWASFVRAWSAETNRHGDALRTWLYLSGRADAGAVARSLQRLLGAGAALAPASPPTPPPTPPTAQEQQEHHQQQQQQQRSTDYYAALMYAAYHLRCGAVAATNAARLAAYHTGEEGEDEVEEGEQEQEAGAAAEEGAAACAAAAASLPRLLAAVAADKARHEAAFSAAAREALRRDPQGALRALSSSIASGALLRPPAAALGDGLAPETDAPGRLFLDAGAVADALGVLTLRDRAAALDALCASWGVAAAGEAAAARCRREGGGDDYPEGAREARARAAFALAHGGRVRALAALQTERRLRDRRRGGAAAGGSAPFAWVFGRECGLS